MGFIGACEPFKRFANPVFAILLSFLNANNGVNIIIVNNIEILKSKTSGPVPANT